jgi:ankyrin repeat protein
MTARQLPERPDLEQLKRQAKELLRSARANDPVALERFRILPAFSSRSGAALGRAPFALLDSWNVLRERVEELSFGFETALDQFLEAATGRRDERAERLLALHPGIAGATFHTALLLGDAAAANVRLTADPALATAPGGPRGWEPLHYVCHSAIGAATATREAGLVDLAQRLIARGADPNTRFPWLHHGVRRPVLWGAVCVVRSLALARALLDAGADPDDGVTLPLSAGMGDVAALELLHAYGANVNHPWATDGGAPLYEILHWAKTPEGARWLLEHGADPDPVFAANGETPLHVVAAGWGAELAEQLVSRGADVSRRRGDGRTPYAVAELSGNRGVAEWLVAHGAASEIADVDRLVAACSRGDRAAARAMLEKSPALRTEISGDHYGALYQAAERNDVAALEAMLECGFDPNRADESIGKTALHVAAMEGWPEAALTLLLHGASMSVRDREFAAQPLIWAAEGSRSWREGRDHRAVGRLLLDAGSPTEWEAGAEPSEAILEIVNEWRGVATE